MGSYALQPPEAYSFPKLFVENQIRTKSRPPPPGTSFEGRTAIITGSNVGIGHACAKVMMELKLSHLIIAVRSLDKGERAASHLRKAHPRGRIDVWQLDLLSYDSVQAFAKRCTGLARLDILILNAGIGAADFVLAPGPGHEQTFQCNYLSTALLALLLLPKLKKSSEVSGQPSRLAVVSSGLSIIANFPNQDKVPLIPSFDDPTGWNLMAGSERYNTTKLLGLMLTHELSRIVSSDQVIVCAVDPGYTRNTQLDAKAPWWVGLILAPLKTVARTPEQAAWTYIDAVGVKGKEVHDSFLLNWKIATYHPMMYTEHGKAVMERLWEETLAELEFAGVGDIVRDVQEQKLKT